MAFLRIYRSSVGNLTKLNLLFLENIQIEAWDKSILFIFSNHYFSEWNSLFSSSNIFSASAFSAALLKLQTFWH